MIANILGRSDVVHGEASYLLGSHIIVQLNQFVKNGIVVSYLDIHGPHESRFVEDIRQGITVEYVSDVPDWAERPFSRESKKEYAGRVMEQHRTG